MFPDCRRITVLVIFPSPLLIYSAGIAASMLCALFAHMWCGVDNTQARSQLEEPGFPFVVEAGIGGSAQDFQALRVHTFPAGRRARDLWVPEAIPHRIDLDKPAYESLSRKGADVCGLTRLAKTAVGAPFVGTVAGCLMLAEILRMIAGRCPDALVDLDLRAVDARRAVRNDVIVPFNPSYQNSPSPDVNGRRSAVVLERA